MNLICILEKKMIEEWPSEEQVLYALLKFTQDKNQIAMMLESYVQKYGPVSNECGDKIKEYIGHWI